MSSKTLIKYCFDTSEDKLKTARLLFKSEKRIDCLFFCHLSLELLLKGIYVQKKKRTFPITHNLLEIVQMAGIKLDKSQDLDLREINTFNIRARYDDYKRSFYKKATQKYTSEWFNKTLELVKWLKRK